VAYGSHSCHTIPGIRGANGIVGPPLDAWARRVYIAGMMPNTPANLLQWSQSPQSFERPTIMPDMRVTAGDARAIASYLYTLQ
jgi:cytochrome c